jgi:4'-phosphopantetheinyl transferase
VAPAPSRSGEADLEALQAGDVHVWYVGLEAGAAGRARMLEVLAADERARAARFVFDRDARRFVVAHAALRGVLGHYVQRPPASLVFTYGPRDKPALAAPDGGLTFNLSHSGELAAIAVGWRCAIGVDVEQERPLPDLEDLAARSFAPAERRVLGALPESERHPAFFRCWTRKEAFIKATGLGLAQPLEAFVVTLAPGEPARFLDIEGDPVQLARWTLLALQPPVAACAGALVVEGAPRSVTVRTWTAEGARA